MVHWTSQRKICFIGGYEWANTGKSARKFEDECVEIYFIKDNQLFLMKSLSSTIINIPKEK